MDMKSWQKKYGRELARNKWEMTFVLQVLSRVDGLQWRFVQAQMPFTDFKGKNRAADFAIKESDHLLIALEVDGYDKRGTGSGMTHEEFVDWQRRHASLEAQGWRVLRFANRDVRDCPDDCAKLIEYLLRNERNKAKHYEAIHRTYINKQNELDKTRRKMESIQDQALESRKLQEELNRLENERDTLARQLQENHQSEPLTEQEITEWKKLDLRQKAHIAELENQLEKALQEGAIMKHSIWAFAFVIIAAMVLLVYVTTDQNRTPSPSIAESGPARVVRGESCENPATWRESESFLGGRAALRGPIAGIRYSREVRGQPTWINIGADFPEPDRLVLVVWGRNRPALSGLLDNLSVGQIICAVGRVFEYEGVPQIEIENAHQIHGPN